MNRNFSSLDIELRVLVDHFSHEFGIAPPDENGNWVGMAAKLNELSPEEARVMKRKWRKLWRQALRKMQKSKGVKRHGEKFGEQLAKKFGVKEKKPTKLHVSERKRAVLDLIMTGHAIPMIQKLARETKEKEAKQKS